MSDNAGERAFQVLGRHLAQPIRAQRNLRRANADAVQALAAMAQTSRRGRNAARNVLVGNEPLPLRGQSALTKALQFQLGAYTTHAPHEWGKHVRELLDLGVDPNTTYGRTVLGVAARWHDLQAVNVALEGGADPNLKDEYGATALILAVGHQENRRSDDDQQSIVERLLKGGADPDIQDNNRNTALHVTIENWDDEETVDQLLVAGANPNLKNGRVVNGDTALTLAARKRQRDVLTRLLQDPRTDVNSKGGGDEVTALMLIANWGSLETIEELLTAGADPNIQSKYGNTALMMGLDHPEIVTRLLAAQANPDAKDRWGKTALIKACSQGLNATVGLLLQAGADPNLRDFYDMTALMYAACNGPLSTVNRLLQAGADPNLKTADGKTALMFAASKERVFTVSELLAAGATPSLKLRNGTSVWTTPEIEAMIRAAVPAPRRNPKRQRQT